MKRRLVINADDLGMTQGVDRAVFDLANLGTVTAASKLSYGGDLDSKTLPGKTGVHLRLTDGYPISDPATIPSLVFSDGKFPRQRGQIVDTLDPEEIEREWLMQIMHSGVFDPTHIDTHSHAHFLPEVFDVYAKLARRMGVAGVPLSGYQVEWLRIQGVPCADFTETRWFGQDLKPLLLEDFRHHEVVHLAAHPAYVDDDLRKASTMADDREVQRQVLASPEFRHWLCSERIELIGMRDLPEPTDALERVDIVFLGWNRREFTAAALEALLRNTDWKLVNRLWMYDDGSTDGTYELMAKYLRRMPILGYLICTDLRSPVAIMNKYLRERPAPWFAKIDSDVVVPPGWLNECISLLRTHRNVDLLGIEAKYKANGKPRTIAETDHIGGIGMMRTAAFEQLPVAAGRLGFSDWQIKNPVTKAWIDPSLPVVLLDRLPFEPWASLSAQYEAKSWQRPWKRYTDSDSWIWDWWHEQRVTTSNQSSTA